MARIAADSVLAAVVRDLGRLPEDLQTCTEAAAARRLARTIDAGITVPLCTKELRAVMADLRLRAAPATKPTAPDVPEDDEPVRGAGVADLASRIAARRQPASG